MEAMEARLFVKITRTNNILLGNFGMENAYLKLKDLGHFPYQSVYALKSQLLVISLYNITQSVPDPL